MNKDALRFNAQDLAAAKFRMLLAAALDTTLSKLAIRALTVIACKRINFKTGAAAFCANATYCLDLGIKSDSAMRAALAELEAGGYLEAEKSIGKVTRFTIADRYFSEDEPRRETRRSDEQTPPQDEADTPPQDEADTPPQDEATNTGKRIPENESRKTNTGNGSLASLAHCEKQQSINLGRRDSVSANRKGKGSTQLTIPTELVESTSDPEGFREFWFAYPKKVGRLEASEAYREARKHAGDDVIAAGAQRYAEARRADNRDPSEVDRFTMAPAKWLRGRHWQDQHAAPRPAGVGKHTAAFLRSLGVDHV